MSHSSSQKSHSKCMFTLFLVIIVVAGLAIYYGVIQPRHLQPSAKEIKIDGVFLPVAREINNFHLVDTQGNSFSKENLIGHWSMLFFGFTNCGNICPVTLSELSKMYKNLQTELPENKLPQVVFISVDPERDTLEKVKAYVNAFNSHFMGARGEMTEVVPLVKQLGIAVVKMQAKNGGKERYTVNHSAEVMLFNPAGKLQAILAYPHKAEQMDSDYRLILTTQEG